MCWVEVPCQYVTNYNTALSFSFPISVSQFVKVITRQVFSSIKETKDAQTEVQYYPACTVSTCDAYHNPVSSAEKIIGLQSNPTPTTTLSDKKSI